LATAQRTAALLLRIGFWVAALGTFAMAVLPFHHGGSFLPWDKAQHFVAFYALTVLALLAFPRAPVLLPAAALSAFGALIEVVQGLPVVHRDSDWHDWLADTLAIAAVLLPMQLARLRRG
jgi:hypothetical protein